MGVEVKIKTIEKQFDENINSHVFLIETDDVENALIDIKKIIMHILNADDITKNQIKDENYIELSIIKPTSKEIIKDDILTLQNYIKTKPILTDKKFYIIKSADCLNDSSSNKLLKTIEEPQEGIYGFLITDNISAILPTIKSRCQIEQFFYRSDVKSTEYDKEEIDLANKIIEIIELGNFEDIIIYKNAEKKAKDFLKEHGKSVANIIKDYYNTAIGVTKKELSKETIKRIVVKNSKEAIIMKAKYLNTTLNKLTINMNAELLIDKIIIELKEVNNNASSWN